jgi:PAS domain S-box-containing protein
MKDIDTVFKNGALTETEERFQYALTASDEGIWDWNYDTDTGYLSPRYFQMLGYDNNEFPGGLTAWTDLLHPEDKNLALEIFSSIFKNKKSNYESVYRLRKKDGTYRSLLHPGDTEQVLEIFSSVSKNKKNSYKSVYRLRTKDGTYRWILSRAIVVRWDEKGVPVRLVGTHADITEDREKDQALLEYKNNLEKEVARQTIELRGANRQLESILNASSESIWVCDGRGEILTINRSAEKLSNLKSDKLIGKNIKTIELEGLVDRSVTLEVIKTGEQISRIQTQRKGGRQLLVTASPVFGDDGKIDMVVVNERDLTHLNKLRDDLQRAQRATNRYKEELASHNLKELKEQGIIAESKEMHQVIETVGKLARSKASPILILGESGTGKGLIAKFVHTQTHGSKKPFVQINCAALPEQLLEAELFGHEKGAFTGALDQGKMGLFEMAKGGTLFLDELGDMSLTVQAKLLKCLEEKEIMHLGGLKPIKIECSVIAATNFDLKNMVRQKKFRQDLFRSFPFRMGRFTTE